MRAIKKQDNYRLYRVDNRYEIWFGVYGKEYSYRAGYVMYPDNFEYAVEIAKDEMKYLMAQGA